MRGVEEGELRKRETVGAIGRSCRQKPAQVFALIFPWCLMG